MRQQNCDTDGHLVDAGKKKQNKCNKNIYLSHNYLQHTYKIDLCI